MTLVTIETMLFGNDSEKTKSFKMQEIRVVIKPFPVFDDSHYSPESLAAACYIYKKKNE